MNKGSKSDTYKTLKYWQSLSFKLVWEGICVGVLSGAVVLLYRFLLEEADTLRGRIYTYLKAHGGWTIPLWFIILIVIGYIIGIIVKKEPAVSGSGIPQVKGILLRLIKVEWIKIVIGKLIGGTLAIGAGLSLGREGPSIQLGAAAAQGFSRILKRLRLEEKFLITSGASAGLAAAFNAPLAGVIFVLEEIHKHFSPLILTAAMAASVSANFICQNLFGQTPIFNFSHIVSLPLNYYHYVVILGVILGVLGWVFNISLVKTQDVYNKQTWLPREFWPVVPILAAGILGFILPDVLGGGHHMVMMAGEGKFAFTILLTLVVVKFLFTMLSYGSGAPGGIFLPLLSIGALIGCIYGNTLTNFLHVDPGFINNFIILGMAGYFTAIVKAPVTGIVLITEMVGSFSHILALTIVSMTAYLVTDMLNSKPVYELLLERILNNKGISKFMGDAKKKTVLEIPVTLGSGLDGKRVRDVEWPACCLLVGVKRGESEIIPKGNTMLYSGDCLIVLIDENKAAEVKVELLGRTGTL